MIQTQAALQERIQSGASILVAEVSPPTTSDAYRVREVAKSYAGKVDALGVCDNRDRVCMSALAAASLIASEGVEPILHVVTRDRNRIALVSDFLGARALGIQNLLCTSGTHQTLGRSPAAKNVFDLDSIQLLQAYANLTTDARIVGEEGINGHGPACLGAAANPFADPLELQMLRLAKKVNAGAQFLITDAIFDLDRFDRWWAEVARRGIHQRVAILAGVRILTDVEKARAYAAKRPDPLVPDSLVDRLASSGSQREQRAAGISIAAEIIERLAKVNGLRGFEICGDGDDEAVLEVLERTGLLGRTT